MPAVRAAKPGRHADGGGLYLEVDATGAKRWVLRVMVQGRRRDIGLGGLSYVSLAEARETARRVRQRIRAVLDWARAAGMHHGPHPVDGIEKALPRQGDRPEHHRALPYAELPDLWPRLEAANGMGALALGSRS